MSDSKDNNDIITISSRILSDQKNIIEQLKSKLTTTNYIFNRIKPKLHMREFSEKIMETFDILHLFSFQTPFLYNQFFIKLYKNML
jgi:hypothetical protein